MRGSAHKAFPPHLRLKSNADFQQVYRKAQKSVGSYFTLLIRENAWGSPRLGLSVSKKKVSNAVTRNRLRRIIRESFRHQRTEEFKNVDIIVIAHKDSHLATNAELFSNLEKQWKRLISHWQTA